MTNITSPVGSAITDVTVDLRNLRRISWGAVFAGVFMGTSVHFLLSLLGAGIGLTTIDPGPGGETPSAMALGISSAIWWTVSNLIALFIGGFAAARLSGLPWRTDGIWHGVLTWAVMLVFMAILLTSAVGNLVGGAFNMLGAAIGGTAQMTTQMMPATERGEDGVLTQMEQWVDQLLAPQGPQALPSDTARRQLAQALWSMVTNEGPAVDQARERAITLIARQTGVTVEQARSQLQAIEQQLQEWARQAAEAADAAANAAAQTAIWGFVAFILGAVAGGAGGLFGARRAVRPS